MKKTALIVLIIAMCLILSGCGSSETPTATVAPTQAPPTAGEWVGENGSFTLLDTGEVSLLKWVLNASGSEFNRCTINIWQENIPVEGGVAEVKSTHTDTGKVSFDVKIEFTSANTATLSYEYDVCGTTITYDKDGNVLTFSGQENVQLKTP